MDDTDRVTKIKIGHIVNNILKPYEDKSAGLMSLEVADDISEQIMLHVKEPRHEEYAYLTSSIKTWMEQLEDLKGEEPEKVMLWLQIAMDKALQTVGA